MESAILKSHRRRVSAIRRNARYMSRNKVIWQLQNSSTGKVFEREKAQTPRGCWGFASRRYLNSFAV
jgi:hypothetical protein